MGFDLGNPLADLTPADQARVKTLGALALSALQTIVFSGGLAWEPALLGFLAGASKLITPDDVRWAIKKAMAAGKLTAFQARIVLAWLEVHYAHLVPEVDQSDLDAWVAAGHGSPPMDASTGATPSSSGSIPQPGPRGDKDGGLAG